MDLKRRGLIAAFIILFLDTFGYGLLFPVLFLNPSFELLSIEIHETTRHLLLSFVLVAFPLAQSFGAPFFGRLSDSWGRKKTLYWTIIGTIAGDILSALALHTRSYPLLLGSQLVTGFFAGNLAICLAIIADVQITKKARGKSFSVVAAILGMSWILSLFTVLFFANPRVNLSTTAPFWCFAALSLLSLFILGAVYKETAPLERPTETPPPRKHTRMLYSIIFFWALGLFTALQWASPIAAEKFHIDHTGVLWFFLSLSTFWILSSLLVNRWIVNHFSLWKVNLWTLFFISLFLFFAGVTDFFLYYLIAYTVSMIFAALVWGNLVTLTSMSAHEKEQGRVMGLIQTMFALSKLFAPFVGGLIAGLAVEPLLYACSLSVMVAFILLLINVSRRSNRELLRQH